MKDLTRVLVELANWLRIQSPSLWSAPYAPSQQTVPGGRAFKFELEPWFSIAKMLTHRTIVRYKNWPTLVGFWNFVTSTQLEHTTGKHHCWVVEECQKGHCLRLQWIRIWPGHLNNAWTRNHVQPPQSLDGSWILILSWFTEICGSGNKEVDVPKSASVGFSWFVSHWAWSKLLTSPKLK